MHLWLSHIRNLESFADNHEAMLDAWADGGVTGVVLGPMQFGMPETLAHSRQLEKLPSPGGQLRAAFSPDPGPYAALGVEAPAPPGAGDEALRERLSAALQRVVDRGFELWLFDPLIGAHAPDADHTADRLLSEPVKAALAARMLDTVAAYPMATGVIIDGPAWGFEITEIPVRRMARRRLLFEELPEHAKPWITAAGYDFDAFTAARDTFAQTLHHLSGAEIDEHEGCSSPDAKTWLGGPDFPTWMTFRQQSVTGLYSYLTDVLRSKADHDVKFAVCPRQPAVAWMAGFDYRAISDPVDVIMTKLYYWQRGYDGTIGTAYRWALTLNAWNPGLGIHHASRIARMLFGDSMPVVDEVIDFDRVLTPHRIGELAGRDAAYSLEAAGNRARVVPWVDSGRAPHDGDPLTARHLEAIVTAASGAGIQHVNFFNSTNLTEADWAMLTHHCGHDWDPVTSPFLPSDRPTL